MSQEKDLQKIKDDLIAGIAHEVRTPLAVIKEGVLLLLDEIPGELNPKQRKILLMMRENTERLVQSVEKKT